MLTSRVDTEAMVGLISVRIPSQRILGRVAMRGLLIKMAIISSSNEIRKAKRPEEIMPGKAMGKTTRRRVVNRLAPRFMAACSSSMSTPRREALMTITTKGVATMVCAITKPARVPFKRNFVNSIKTATAVTRMGATMGEMISALIRFLPGKRPRTSP